MARVRVVRQLVYQKYVVRAVNDRCTVPVSQKAAYLTGQNILLDGGAYPGTF